ncbi:thioredoxin-like protein [Suillus cothurnatus]|nr:thioredoxin-like protein [Suillus cothurnatus]
MSEQLTLYLHKLSPYSQKVQLALTETNAPYRGYHVDLFNKPKWFTSKVNPVGKVPTLTYGGPSVDPEDPSPLSAKMTESNVILEFLADLYPDSGLLPKDPVLRAKVRFFVDATTKHIDTPFYDFVRGQGSYEDVLKGIEYVQGLLEEGGDFAVGDHYTIADACISPHLARLKTITETDLGKFAVGMGLKLGEELKGPKFTKFTKYAEQILERPSSKQTYDEEIVITYYKSAFVRTQ